MGFLRKLIKKKTSPKAVMGTVMGALGKKPQAPQQSAPVAPAPAAPTRYRDLRMQGRPAPARSGRMARPAPVQPGTVGAMANGGPVCGAKSYGKK